MAPSNPVRDGRHLMNTEPEPEHGRRPGESLILHAIRLQRAVNHHASARLEAALTTQDAETVTTPAIIP